MRSFISVNWLHGPKMWKATTKLQRRHWQTKRKIVDSLRGRRRKKGREVERGGSVRGSQNFAWVADAPPQYRRRTIITMKSRIRHGLDCVQVNHLTLDDFGLFMPCDLAIELTLFLGRSKGMSIGICIARSNTQTHISIHLHTLECVCVCVFVAQISMLRSVTWLDDSRLGRLGSCCFFRNAFLWHLRNATHTHTSTLECVNSGTFYGILMPNMTAILYLFYLLVPSECAWMSDCELCLASISLFFLHFLIHFWHSGILLLPFAAISSNYALFRE